MVGGKHPETELIAYLREELAGPDRRRVAEHLAGCAECARAAAVFGEILRELGATVPTPPEIHWGAYRAQLRERLQARRDRQWTWRWLRWPLPAALAAAAAGALLILALQTGRAPGPNGDFASLEERVVAGRLELLRQYSMLERLDLWEDLDVVRRLDQLPRGEG